MIKWLLYMSPIFLIGLIAGAVPASAALRSDGGARDPVAAPAESTDAPIILRSVAGVVAAGVAVVVGGGMVQVAASAGWFAGGHGRLCRWGTRWLCRRSTRWLCRRRYTRCAAGSRNWSGVSASNRSVNAGNFNRTNVNTPTSTVMSTFPAAAMAAAITAVQAGAASPPA